MFELQNEKDGLRIFKDLVKGGFIWMMKRSEHYQKEKNLQIN